MKNFIFSLTLLLFVVKSFSQTATSSAISKDYYLKKSKNQKTIGWILLGSGGGLIITGIIVQSSNEKNHGGSYAGGEIALVGIVPAVASIPFFISSSKNKRKAASIAISDQNLFFPQQNRLALKTQPTFTLKIAF